MAHFPGNSQFLAARLLVLHGVKYTICLTLCPTTRGILALCDSDGGAYRTLGELNELGPKTLA